MKIACRCYRRQYALTRETQPGQLAQREGEDIRGQGEPNLPAEYVSQKTHEFAMDDRLGRRRIDWAGQPRRIDRKFDQSNQIAEMDPRHPLPAASELRRDAESHRQHHRRQHAAVAAQDEADAQATDANALRLHSARGSFPSGAESRHEDVLATALLGQNRISSVAVKTNRGTVDEDRGFVCEPANERFNTRRDVQAAVEKDAFAPGGPQAAHQGLAGKIDHGIDAAGVLEWI